MTNKLGQLIPVVLITFFMSFAFANNATKLSCLKGSDGDQGRYEHAVSLYKKGFRDLSIQEKNQVVIAIDLAVKNKCKQAAVIRFYLEIFDLGGAAKILDDKSYGGYEDTLYLLIREANQLDEGWFELGNLKLRSDSAYYAPSEAKLALEKAALMGDDRAMNQLISIYAMGQDGIEVDERRSKYWQEKLDAIRSKEAK